MSLYQFTNDLIFYFTLRNTLDIQVNFKKNIHEVPGIPYFRRNVNNAMANKIRWEPQRHKKQ